MLAASLRNSVFLSAAAGLIRRGPSYALIQVGRRAILLRPGKATLDYAIVSRLGVRVS